jgi:hypothetical protein
LEDGPNSNPDRFKVAHDKLMKAHGELMKNQATMQWHEDRATGIDPNTGHVIPGIEARNTAGSSSNVNPGVGSSSNTAGSSSNVKPGQGPSNSSQPNACVKWDDSTFTHGQTGMENASPIHLLEINYILDYLIKAFFTIAFVISPAIISVNLSLITLISSFYFSLIIVTLLLF